jgi:hypothetical protein
MPGDKPENEVKPVESMATVNPYLVYR